MKISNIQKDLTQYVFTNTNIDTVKKYLTNENSDENTERLEIYRNNTLHSLSESIIDLYPSIEHVVGNDFLRATAKEYLKVSPPNSATLLDFALDFPEFLMSFEHTKKYAYLPDLARIDALRHQSYHAADETALTVEQIQNIPLDQLAEYKVQLPSSCYLIESPFKCFTLWENIKKENNSELSVEGNENILIFRNTFLVETISIDDGQAYFIQQLINKIPLGKSLEYTLESFNDYNTALLFSLLITNELIISLF